MTLSEQMVARWQRGWGLGAKMKGIKYKLPVIKIVMGM